MRAVTVSNPGPSPRIAVMDMPTPSWGPEEVLIRIAAAGVNPVDWKEAEGNLEQFFHYPDRWIPGLDGAGVIERTGEAVTGFNPGDRVLAFSDRQRGHNGTFAEYVRVHRSLLAIVPPGIPLEEAATIPTAGVTAWQALFRANKGGLSAGDNVFIHGGSGGMGSYGIQFAKAHGLRVAASSSAANLDYIRSLGADLAVDYRKGGLAAAVREWMPDGVDAVIDCVSAGSLPDALDALGPGGRVIRIPTLTHDGDAAVETAEAKARGCTVVHAFVEYDQVGPELTAIMALIAEGKVKTPPITAFPLDQAPEAFRRMKAGGIAGKLVLTV